MKKFFNKLFGNDARARLRSYWRSLMRSKKHVNMSEGSQEINRVMTAPHKDEWRRDSKK